MSDRTKSSELKHKLKSYLVGTKKISKTINSKSESKPDNEVISHQNSPQKEDLEKQRMQLLKRMEERAVTAQEKYEVLNCRDNYLRLKETKNGECKRKKVNGTCPDMCPEKERYSRIAKNCSSIFETKMAFDSMSSSKDVVHCYMVKEYSRSSADQQEPLPHELRPVSVLKFTMDYLICNVIDRKNSNISISDWYDFIWNRTRSIRKDITQQQLCDVECVEILEKCARFHILCAELLSEEDTIIFDPKINNENLTKCLQTLKHMYHDLQTKGIQCLNEAEFRAYDILLSLTEGETLRLVKDVRKEILYSPPVKAAFDAALAFKSNNYVKFFKILEKGTYLDSCILHRYIHEARVSAMQVIIRAYSVPNNPTLIPLIRLVKDLKFENVLDASNFCTWHGLTVDDTYVTIQRQAFQKPASVYPIARATFLVGKKMQTSLSEIINKGPLPQNPLEWYQPYNSFNEEGLLLNKLSVTDDTAVESRSEDDMDAVSFQPEENSSMPALFTTQENSIFEFNQSKSESKYHVPPANSNSKATFNSEAIKSKFSDVSRNDAIAPMTAAMKTDMQHSNISINTSSFVSKNISSTTKPFITSTMQSPPPTKKCDVASSLLETSLKPVENYLLKSPTFFSTPTTFSVRSPLGCEVVAEETNDASFVKLSETPQSFDENAFSINGKHLEESSYHEDSNSKNDISHFDEIEDEEDSLLHLEMKNEEALEKLRDKKIAEIISVVSEEIYAQCIEELCYEICEPVLIEEWNKKVEHDNELEKIRVILAKKTFYKWRLFCERKKQRKMYENVEPISPWVPMLTNTEFVYSGASSPFSAYKKHCSLSRLIESKLEQKSNRPGWEPFSPTHFEWLHNIPVFPPIYLKSIGINRFFKLCIIFASYDDCSFSLFMEWMCKKFKLSSISSESKESKLLSFYTLNGGKTLLCVQGVILESNASLSSNNFLNGLSAMFLCIPTKFPNSLSFTTILNQFKLLISNSSLVSAFPLFVFLLSTTESYNAVSQLSTFLDQQRGSNHAFSAVKMNQLSIPLNYTSLSNELLRAVKWSVQNQEQVPVVQACSLHNYIEDSFASVFSVLHWKLSLQESYTTLS
ncbi:germinal-center associated nuclear protein, partial [Caerostris extrusa]